jgi:hypothetical protein
MTDTAPQVIKRHYFVRFKAVIGQQGQIVEGALDITREQAITGMDSIEQICSAINNMLREHQKLPISCPVMVEVVFWQPFEEEFIIRAH